MGRDGTESGPPVPVLVGLRWSPPQEDRVGRGDVRGAGDLRRNDGGRRRPLEKARALTPYDPEILVVLARIRFRQGRGPEALALLARARELEPESGELADLSRRMGGP
jgi:hypothetical protein